jgi:hypothetical protein
MISPVASGQHAAITVAGAAAAPDLGVRCCRRRCRRRRHLGSRTRHCRCPPRRSTRQTVAACGRCSTLQGGGPGRQAGRQAASMADCQRAAAATTQCTVPHAAGSASADCQRAAAATTQCTVPHTAGSASAHHHHSSTCIASLLDFFLFMNSLSTTSSAQRTPCGGRQGRPDGWVVQLCLEAQAAAAPQHQPAPKARH